MAVFHVFEIVQMILNRAKHHKAKCQVTIKTLARSTFEHKQYIILNINRFRGNVPFLYPLKTL